MVSKAYVAEALKLQKMTVTFSHNVFTSPISILASGEIYLVIEVHENMKILSGLKLVAMATVTSWISREPFDRIN